MNISFSKKLLFVFAAISMLVLSSCKKYEEGPGFSLKTKTSRLTGEWDVIEVKPYHVDDSLGFMTIEEFVEYSVGSAFDKNDTVSFKTEAAIVYSFRKNGDFEIESDGYNHAYHITMGDTLKYELNLEGESDGTWSWSEDKESIEMDYYYALHDNDDLKVIKLTNKEFWFKNNAGEEWHFEKK